MENFFVNAARGSGGRGGNFHRIILRRVNHGKADAAAGFFREHFQRRFHRRGFKNTRKRRVIEILDVAHIDKAKVLRAGERDIHHAQRFLESLPACGEIVLRSLAFVAQIERDLFFRVRIVK